MKEQVLKAKAGMPKLILFILLYLVAIALIILGGFLIQGGAGGIGALSLTVGILWVIIGFIPFLGLKIIKPQEALVLTLFGKYLGTLKDPGFYYVHPFSVAVNPAAKTRLGQSGDVDSSPKLTVSSSGNVMQSGGSSKKITLKIMTLNNSKQKVNDVLGNPVEIGIAVMWRVVDTAKAVFNVDNYKEYLSLQCDSAVRNIVRIYPYDVAQGIDTTGDGEPDEGSLRGSSSIVAERIRKEIQDKVEDAGLEIIEARITYLVCSGNCCRHAAKATSQCPY